MKKRPGMEDTAYTAINREQRRERNVKRISHVLQFLLIFFSIVGMFSLFTGRVNLWKGTKDSLDIALGLPGTPIEDIRYNVFNADIRLQKEMNETLQGIEDQLERMNDIQLKIHQENR